MQPLQLSVFVSLAAVLVTHHASAAFQTIKLPTRAAAHPATQQPGPAGYPDRSQSSASNASQSCEPFSIRFPGFIGADQIVLAKDEPSRFALLQNPRASLLPDSPSSAGAAPESSVKSANANHASGSNPGKSDGIHGNDGDAHGRGEKVGGTRDQQGNNETDRKGRWEDCFPASAPAPIVSATAVPEPTTALFGAVLLGICGWARRRTSSVA